jgi:hypothetical protein
MNCLSNLEIQMYQDGELANYEHDKAKEHIDSCPACATVYETIKKNKAQVFELFDKLYRHDTHIEIPVFIPSSPKRKYLKLITIATIAASFFFLIGFVFHLRKQHIQQERTANIAKATMELTRNTDPNQMLHNKQMIVVITNSSGEVVHSFITE